MDSVQEMISADLVLHLEDLKVTAVCTTRAWDAFVAEHGEVYPKVIFLRDMSEQAKEHFTDHGCEFVKLPNCVNIVVSKFASCDCHGLGIHMCLEDEIMEFPFVDHLMHELRQFHMLHFKETPADAVCLLLHAMQQPRWYERVST